MLEGAASELARLGRAQAVDALERRKDRRDHRPAAMKVELGDILTGHAVRSRKADDQRPVEDLARDDARSQGAPCAARASAPASACTAASALGPLIRTTATAAGGAPDDKAKMVSVSS